MNLENTLKFINELNDKNIQLQEEKNNLEKENDQLKNNLDSLTKVSYLNNINKQLQEKVTQNELLSKQLEKANIIISAFQKIKELNINFDSIINKPELIIDKSEPIINKSEPIINKSERMIDNDEPIKTVEAEIDLEEEFNYEKIQYKRTNYLLDPETNKVYNILDNKPNNHVADFINNKLKFI
jgi:vacuolar-type H+-ATPase subunit I/STV1